MKGVGVLDNETVNAAVRRAASAVVSEWPGVVGVDDLAQELWVEILESPATQKVLAGKNSREMLNLLARMGHRIAARYRNSNARFSNQVQYSVDDIKAALSGHTLWGALLDDLAAGLESLRERSENYAEAIRLRYFERINPGPDADRKRLSRALEALTEEVNRQVRAKFARLDASPGRTLGDGPGTRSRAFPVDVKPPVRTVFDDEFRGEEMELYRGWVLPESYPEVKPAMIHQWDEYAQEDFGGR